MTHYDYKVVPAPRRAKRIKGVRGAEDLFAMTLTEALNEQAREGWEYVRAEHIPTDQAGWFRSGTTTEQTLLVFRRAREQVGPRIAALRGEIDAARDGDAPAVPPEERRSAAERAAVDRLQNSLKRREPSLRLEPVTGGSDEPTPIRPPTRLGPADKS